jgi:cytochrome c oxidase subunit 4
MSTATQGHHHILPLKVYLTVGASLLVLTAVTVWISTFDFGPYNLVVAMIIAAIKGLLVAFFFMHLYYDSKLYFSIFAFAIAFLAVFIVFTMFDTQTRADVNEIEGQTIQPKAAMYDNLPAAPAHGADSAAHSPKPAPDSTAHK